MVFPETTARKKPKFEIPETPRELWPTTPGKKPEDAVRGFADNLFAQPKTKTKLKMMKMMVMMTAMNT